MVKKFKCWKKNPKCDEETKLLVAAAREEKEKEIILQDW